MNIFDFRNFRVQSNQILSQVLDFRKHPYWCHLLRQNWRKSCRAVRRNLSANVLRQPHWSLDELEARLTSFNMGLFIYRWCLAVTSPESVPPNSASEHSSDGPATSDEQGKTQASGRRGCSQGISRSPGSFIHYEFVTSSWKSLSLHLVVNIRDFLNLVSCSNGKIRF